MRPARVLAAATLLCTYGMVGCAVYSFVVRESLDLVFYGTLPLTVLCGLLCVVHIVLASHLAGREEAMPLCRLALGWKLLEAPYFLTNFVLWLLVSGAFLVVPGLQLGLVAVLAVGCALVSILFCRGLHITEHLAARVLKDPFLRAAAGGCVIVAATLLLGTTDYNGAGMDVVARALSGQADPWAWLLKLAFTAVTIGCGFKGGEVVPSFFVGATFGCVLGGLLGLPPAFAAAIGLVSVFCGAVNCPIASVILSIELFGSGGLVYFAAACALSYLLSGYCGLYSSQTILYSKLKAEFINVHTHE